MDRSTVTVTEAAAILGIARSTAYECVRRGELSAIRLGRRLVVPKSALAELLGTQRIDAPQLHDPQVQ